MASSWMDEAHQRALQYSDALKQRSQYIIDQQNQAKQNSLNVIENERTNAVNQLNANKDTINQTALDNAKQANINRMLALKDNSGAMSRAGLAEQGLVGSQVNSINNNYGTNLNSILKDKANQLQGVNDQINSTNLQYDTNRINAMNDYDSKIASLQSQIDQQALNQYNTIYQQTLAQKQQEYENQQAEAARAEAIRQFNVQMELQRQQNAASNALSWAKYNQSNTNFTNSSNNSKKIQTDYYSGEINSDTRYGVFNTADKNGVKYQPDNVGGNKLKGSGYKVSDLFGNGWQGKSGASLSNQKVWKTNTGRYYVWDGSQNSYIDVTSKLKSVGNMFTAPTGVTFTK